MADDTSILRVAEAERDHPAQALDRHLHGNPGGCQPGCGDCRALREHVTRTQRQVALLTAGEAGSEALW